MVKQTRNATLRKHFFIISTQASIEAIKSLDPLSSLECVVALSTHPHLLVDL